MVSVRFSPVLLVVNRTYGVRRYIDSWEHPAVPGRRAHRHVGRGRWAIRFYRRHGFELMTPEWKTALLEGYWTIPERQIETSVVLADPPFGS